LFRVYEGLDTPEIFERVRHAKLATKAKRFQIPESRVAHFDRMSGFPMGLLPLGDVIGTFNPLLAQGMTIAALHAETLGATLAAHVGDGQALPLSKLDEDYIPAAVALSVTAWTAGAYADMLYPATKGERLADFDDYHAFGRALRAMMSEDSEIHRLAVRISQLLDPPLALPRYKIIARVASERMASC
jgi:2-polyprenyl-6-methoxyphenol hydroxylase-like FAD-dependent oxidoreductase